MKPFQLELSPSAAEFIRDLELYERLPLIDFFDQIRSGLLPEEDFGELTLKGELISVNIIAKHAVYYRAIEEDRKVKVFRIELADRNN